MANIGFTDSDGNIVFLHGGKLDNSTDGTFKIYGGDATGNATQIFGNSIDTDPYIQITGDGVITFTNSITGVDAAGPSINDETSTATNPTLCPIKSDLTTGIGGTASALALVSGGVETAQITDTQITAKMIVDCATVTGANPAINFLDAGASGATWGAAAGYEVDTVPTGWIRISINGTDKLIPYWDIPA